MPVRRVHSPGSPTPPRSISLRDRGAQRRPPAQQPDQVTHAERRVGHPARHLDEAGVRVSEPAAIGEQHLIEGQSLRSGDLQRNPDRRAGPQEVQHRRHEVVELDHLQQPRARHARQHRQRGQAAEQRAAAIGRAPDHHGGPQDHPVEVAAHQRLIADVLAAGEGGGGAAVDADGGDMHDAPHARLLAGREQGGRPVHVHAGCGIARAVLQHAGAVDDRVDAGEVRQPVGGRLGLGDVEGDAPRRSGEPAARAGAAHDGRHLVPLAAERRQHRRADQPGRTRQQHAQGVHSVARNEQSGVIPGLVPR